MKYETSGPYYNIFLFTKPFTVAVTASRYSSMTRAWHLCLEDVPDIRGQQRIPKLWVVQVPQTIPNEIQRAYQLIMQDPKRWNKPLIRLVYDQEDVVEILNTLNVSHRLRIASIGHRNHELSSLCDLHTTSHGTPHKQAYWSKFSLLKPLWHTQEIKPNYRRKYRG